MCPAAERADNGGVRASRAAVWAGVCIGVATLAEIGTVVVARGSAQAYQGVLFGLNTVVIVVIGGLVAIRHPGNPIGWILAGFGTFDALFGLAGAYGPRASSQGWPA